MAVAQVRNKDGQFVEPNDDTFAAAAAGANWSAAPGFGISLPSQPGPKSWPITGATFILVHKAPDKAEEVAETLKFFDWAFKKGAAMATELDYVPLPAALTDQVRKGWGEIKDKSGKALYQGQAS